MLKRISALMLAVLMLVSVCVACGKSEGNGETTTTSAASGDVGGEDTTSGGEIATEPAETEEQRDVTIENYGRQFAIYQSGNWGYKDFLAEEVTGEPVNDAVYTMMSNVSEEFGITFTVVDESAKTSTGGRGAGFTAISNMHMSGSKDYDIASVGCYDVSTLAYTGYLADLAAVNNIDFSKSWWDQKAYEQLNLDGKMYYATGDAMTLDNDCTYCLLFNKSVVNENKLEDPYQLVKDNKWTYEKFIEMGQSMAADLNGDGKRDTNDAYAITVWQDAGIGMLHATGGAVGRVNGEGVIEMTLISERNLNILSTWTQYVASENCYSVGGSSNEEAHRPFTTDNSLFYTRYVKAGTWFRDTDLDFGYLPYPKWDDQQEDYCNTMHAYGTAWLCIPSSCTDVEQSGAVLESLSYYGQQLLNPAYYEITLEGKTIRDEESAEMLDIIFASRFFDIGVYYRFGGYSDSLINAFYNGRDNYSSLFKATEKIAAKEVENVMASFDKLD